MTRLGWTVGWCAVVVAWAAVAEADSGTGTTTSTSTSTSTGTDAGAKGEADNALEVTLAAGLGVGTRSYARPVGTGVEALETTPFTAVDVGLLATVWPEERFSLEIGLRFQTSVGMTVQLEPPFALPERLHVRSERLEIGVAPVWRTSSSRRSLGFAFPVGFTLRMFWPEVRETVPGWYLAGPHMRVEVVAPLWDWLDLRFGPELYWVAGVHPALEADGVASMGVGAGMEASLLFRLGTGWALDLSYREGHAFVSGESGAEDFRDNEHFVTLRLRGTP